MEAYKIFKARNALLMFVCHRVHHLCVTGYTICVSQGIPFVCHRVHHLCVTGYTICVSQGISFVCHRERHLCVTGYTICVSHGTPFVCHRVHHFCVTGYTICNIFLVGLSKQISGQYIETYSDELLPDPQVKHPSFFFTFSSLLSQSSKTQQTSMS